MDIQRQKLELIQMLMHVETSSVLEEVRNVISKSFKNDEIDIIKNLLDQSEKEYSIGATENFENILSESKEKYFKE